MPLTEPGEGPAGPGQDVCTPPVCLWDSQLPEAGDAGRGQGGPGTSGWRPFRDRLISLVQKQ